MFLDILMRIFGTKYFLIHFKDICINEANSKINFFSGPDLVKYNCVKKKNGENTRLHTTLKVNFQQKPQKPPDGQLGVVRRTAGSHMSSETTKTVMLTLNSDCVRGPRNL